MFGRDTQVYFCPLHSNIKNTCCEEPLQITHTHTHARKYKIKDNDKARNYQYITA